MKLRNQPAHAKLLVPIWGPCFVSDNLQFERSSCFTSPGLAPKQATGVTIVIVIVKYLSVDGVERFRRSLQIFGNINKKKMRRVICLQHAVPPLMMMEVGLLHCMMGVKFDTVRTASIEVARGGDFIVASLHKPPRGLHVPPRTQGQLLTIDRPTICRLMCRWRCFPLRLGDRWLPPLILQTQRLDENSLTETRLRQKSGGPGKKKHII